MVCPLLDLKSTHGAELSTSAMTLHLRRLPGCIYVCASYRGYTVEVMLKAYGVQLDNFWIKQARTDQVIPRTCKIEPGTYRTPVFHSRTNVSSLRVEGLNATCG